MPQDVDMIIEVKGGAGKKHLHLKAELNTISMATATATGGDGLVNWRVSLDSRVSASSIGLTAVTVWFPHIPPIFVQSVAVPIPVREVTIPLAPTTPSTYVVSDNVLLGSVILTLNPSFPLPSPLPKGKFAVPIGIYCTVDGGQDATPLPPPKDFDQRGRQMIDGKHSHPECNVGP